MKEYDTVLQNQPVDVSKEFARQDNHFFVGSKVLEFDPRTASGRILWKGLALKQRVSYHQLTLQFEDYKVWEDLPAGEYEDDQDFSFSLSFVTPRTVRLRLAARPGGLPRRALAHARRRASDRRFLGDERGRRLVYHLHRPA